MTTKLEGLSVGPLVEELFCGFSKENIDYMERRWYCTTVLAEQGYKQCCLYPYFPQTCSLVNLSIIPYPYNIKQFSHSLASLAWQVQLNSLWSILPFTRKNLQVTHT